MPSFSHVFNAANASLEGGSGELPKIALPFEEGAPKPEVRKRKTYVTLDRTIRFGITPGCRGCAKISEKGFHTQSDVVRAYLQSYLGT